MAKKLPPDWSELADPQIGRRHWRLGELELDELRRELRLGGTAVAIEPRPLDCLMALLRRPQQVVTKQELTRWVWSGRPMSDAVLTKSIAKLRSAIGDETQQIIKTVHGFGYRLCVAPTAIDPLPAKLQLKAGQCLPRHPALKIKQALGDSGQLWLADAGGSDGQRVLAASVQSHLVPALRSEWQFSRTLTIEAQALTLPVLEFQFEHPPYFVARAPLPGPLLPDWLQTKHRFAQASREQRLIWLAHCCQAVAAVHAAGLDFAGRLSPECFVVTQADAEPLSVKLLSGQLAVEKPLARPAGLFLPGYEAPEVRQGLPSGPKADVFALGLIALQVLTGRWSTVLAPGWEALIADRGLVDLLRHASHQSPSQRLSSASELAQGLLACGTSAAIGVSLQQPTRGRRQGDAPSLAIVEPDRPQAGAAPRVWELAEDLAAPLSSPPRPAQAALGSRAARLGLGWLMMSLGLQLASHDTTSVPQARNPILWVQADHAVLMPAPPAAGQPARYRP